MNTTISFDESGNTGPDLLNIDQRAFILASNNFDNESLNILINLFENKDEIHFIKLKKSQLGRDSIIKFLNHKLITEDNILNCVCDKEYIIVGKIVDYLIEPVLQEINVNIYDKELNKSYTDCLYVFGQHFFDKIVFKEMLKSFMSLVRNKTIKSIELFYKSAKKLYEKHKDYEEVLFPIICSEKYINEIIDVFDDKYAVDVTYSVFLELCRNWSEKLKLPLDILFDNSKQILHYEEWTNSLIRNSMENDTSLYTINSVKLVDSLDYPSIQISDLIASSLTFAYNNKNPKQEPFTKEIKNSNIFKLSNFRTIMYDENNAIERLEKNKYIIEYSFQHLKNKFPEIYFENEYE